MNKLKVVYAIKETGVRLEKEFESPYLCQKFVNKLKRSKRAVLISYPMFA